MTTDDSYDDRGRFAALRLWIAVIAAGACGVAAAFWMTLPPHALALDETCHAASPFAQVSAAIYPRAFWTAQRAAVEAEVQRVQLEKIEWDHEPNGNQPGPQVDMTPIEKKMSRLSDKAAEEEAARRGRELQTHIDWLARCDEAIVDRLKR